ncbi:hypothetical protein BKC65_02165 [Salmonella enterica subsp. enterica serovar Agona]|nr:hypothetical protein [Salmonella enterica subsp. enterica serovar Agona]
MTAQPSREQLKARCESEIEQLEITLKNGCSDTPHHIEEKLAIYRLALAGMSSEPVAVAGFDAATAIRACMDEFPESVQDIVEECAQIAENTISSRHAAPPAPVAVLPAPRQFDYYCTKYPEMPIGDGIIRSVEWNNCIAEVKRLNSAPVAAPEEVFNRAYERYLKGVLCGDSNKQAALSFLNACRAAMQAEHVTTATVPDGAREALSEAVAAIYFTDSSDYLLALFAVVKALSPETLELLLSNAKAAYDATRIAAAPAAPEREV